MAKFHNSKFHRALWRDLHGQMTIGGPGDFDAATRLISSPQGDIAYPSDLERAAAMPGRESAEESALAPRPKQLVRRFRAKPGLRRTMVPRRTLLERRKWRRRSLAIACFRRRTLRRPTSPTFRQGDFRYDPRSVQGTSGNCATRRTTPLGRPDHCVGGRLQRRVILGWREQVPMPGLAWRHDVQGQHLLCRRKH